MAYRLHMLHTYCAAERGGELETAFWTLNSAMVEAINNRDTTNNQFHIDEALVKAYIAVCGGDACPETIQEINMLGLQMIGTLHHPSRYTS